LVGPGNDTVGRRKRAVRDGAGAVTPGEWAPGNRRIVGQARESDQSEGVSEVTACLGIADPSVFGDRPVAHRERLTDLETWGAGLASDEPGEQPAPGDD
jgi:hypothetical protein